MPRREVFFGALLALFACDSEHVPPPPAEYVGRASCVKCHEQQHRLWTGSHHDLAMQEATAKTVLGHFDDVTFRDEGVESKFYKKDGKFFVRTDGPDGKLHDYRVKYTFGVEPLQQYLVEFPGGRLQALRTCWDTRPEAAGGQRWFHLYPDERIDHNDELHWTGRRQNWNHTCAECHSTNLQKNYDPKTNSYNTTWSEIDVSCEACHGPGSRHIRWAGSKPPPADDPSKGLVVTLKSPGTWSFEAGSPNAVRKPPLASHLQVETCARCHSRRTSFHGWVPGQRLLDAHLPALLRDPLYHADGQIRDEVYVYGSFLQSRMYHAGVTCSDCHDPHSLKPVATGNSLCVRCHDGATYHLKSHHFHEVGTPGASCVECHMPHKHYMVVDPRRDHSIRIPRPDLSVKLGTPNACNRCHQDRSAKWAAAEVAKWYPKGKRGPHFGEVLQKARAGEADAQAALSALVADKTQPGIVRATALSSLANPRVLQEALADADPLVRLGGLRGLASLSQRERLLLALPLVEDPHRVLRMEAAATVAPLARNIRGSKRAVVDKAVQEYIDAQLFNADQGFGHFNLGLLYGGLGRRVEAEAAYRRALALEPRMVQA
ncbi:MAG: multiheme c-type cytochrome, partial [Planctomycetota bacterium]